MTIEVLKSKIHRVTVTEARLDYIGSITVDEDLLDAAGTIPGEPCLRLHDARRGPDIPPHRHLPRHGHQQTHLTLHQHHICLND